MSGGVCLAAIFLLAGGLNVVRYLNVKFASLDIFAASDQFADSEQSNEETAGSDHEEFDPAAP